MSPRDRELLERAADSIRQAGILDRSAMLGRLFDHLLDRSLAGETPKEIEIAQALFARPGADVLNDASVRVCIHRLRRKLENHYAGAGRDEPFRLTLPKGDYRFIVTSDDDGAARTAKRSRISVIWEKAGRWRAAMALLLALNLAFVAALLWRGQADAQEAVRSSQVWSAMLANDRPLLIVVGDYYIFGEGNGPDEVDHLVRRFDINSRRDFEQLLMARPELRNRYTDIGLSYLPVGAAGAIRRIAPVIDAAAQRGRLVRVVPISELTAPMITSCDIVYVGLISGLGVLKDAVFKGTRFTVGDSYDEIVDRKSGRSYMADLSWANTGNTPSRDYAYVSALPGPTGTRILIVTGTRDSGVQSAADVITAPDMLVRIGKVAGDGGFEGLYRVDRLADENYNRAEIAVARRPVRALWDPGSFRLRVFPDSGPKN